MSEYEVEIYQPTTHFYYVFVTLSTDKDEIYMVRAYADRALSAERIFLDQGFVGSYDSTVHCCHALEVIPENQELIQAYVMFGVIPTTQKSLINRIHNINRSLERFEKYHSREENEEDEPYYLEDELPF